MFDNHRTLHERVGLADPRRHCRICNVSREMLRERFWSSGDGDVVVPVRRGDIDQAGAHLEIRVDARQSADDTLSWLRAPSSEFGPVGTVSAESALQVTSALISMAKGYRNGRDDAPDQLSRHALR